MELTTPSNMTRSRSMNRSRALRQSWPSLLHDERESNDMIAWQKELQMSVQNETQQVTSTMAQMRQDNSELQQQAAAVARDFKSALQTLHAQQQFLTASISKESQRIEGIQQNQSEIAGGMHQLDSQQSRQESTLNQHREAVSQLESNQNALGQGMTNAMNAQTDMQLQMKSEMEAAYYSSERLRTQ